MSLVEPWAIERLSVLAGCPFISLRALDFSADRLFSTLDQFSADEAREDFECDLNRRVLRAYELCAQTVRIGCTSARSSTQSVSELFRFGHIKEHRPDLPQGQDQCVRTVPRGLAIDEDCGLRVGGA